MAILQKLTKDEIEDIVDSLPRFLAATTKVAAKMREQVQAKLRLQLQDIEMVKTPESIAKFKKLIVNQHFNSLVSPGEPVGIRAAEAMSQPTTQMALNAFHSAGSSSSSTVASGIDAIKELYEVKAKRGVENCKIHFKNKDLTFEDVIELRRKFVGVTVASLLPKKEFMSYTANSRPWWYNTFFDVNAGNRERRLPFDEDDDDTSKHVFLRLTFKSLNLYEYEITTTDIAKVFNRNIDLICIPSPTSMGIVDIFVDTTRIQSDLSKKVGFKNRGYGIDFSTDISPLLYLEIILIPEFSEITISGIPGITQIFPPPNPIPVISIVENEEKTAVEGVWRLYLNRLLMILEGVPLVKLLETLRMCDMTITKIESDYLDVYVKDLQTKAPLKIILDRMSEETRLIEQDFENRKKTEKYPRKISTEFSRASTYIYATSNGTNLPRLLAHPSVDPTTTMSTNPHEILKTLGIEAARNFLIKSYNEVVKANDEYVNARHISLVADFQTSKGSLVPITSKGAAQQNSSTLAKASFEEPMPAFIDAAVFGKVEEIKNTSSSIFVGKRMILGTGSFKARIDKDALDKADKLREEYRAANANLYASMYGRLSDSEQDALTQNAISDEDLLDHGSEGADELGKGTIGLVSTQVIGNTLARFKEPDFKAPTPVPKVIVTTLSLPDFVKGIVVSTIDETKTSLGLGPKVGLKAKVSSQAVRNTISKKGLPAISKLTATQLVSRASTKKVLKGDLDSLDVNDLDLDI